MVRWEDGIPSEERKSTEPEGTKQPQDCGGNDDGSGGDTGKTKGLISCQQSDTSFSRSWKSLRRGSRGEQCIKNGRCR